MQADSCVGCGGALASRRWSSPTNCLSPTSPRSTRSGSGPRIIRAGSASAKQWRCQVTIGRTTRPSALQLRQFAETADGAPVSAVAQKCRDFQQEHPFAASAVMAALDMPLFLAHADPQAQFPISAPVSGDWPGSELRRAVEAKLRSGYDYIKVKVGRDFDSNVAAARCVLTKWPGRDFHVVFDANQAHSIDVAFAFADVLRSCASARLQWYEQPMDRRDWQGMERLCRDARVPIVLDECIYSQADVRRAAAIGAYGVKLKLCKNFGIAETLSLARLARRTRPCRGFWQRRSDRYWQFGRISDADCSGRLVRAAERMQRLCQVAGADARPTPESRHGRLFHMSGIGRWDRRTDQRIRSGQCRMNPILDERLAKSKGEISRSLRRSGYFRQRLIEK